MDNNRYNKEWDKGHSSEASEEFEITDLAELKAMEDEEEEEEYVPPRKKHIFRFGVLITLLAFVALAYSWLPLILPPNLDFLDQNRTLSEDELVLQSKPAIVNIKTHEGGATDTGHQGTGFNLDPQGLIVTNRHVIDSASAVEITFADGTRYIGQEIEFIEGYDLAVIRLQGQDLPFLTLEAESLPEAGQIVTIIGNPYGFQRVSARGEILSYAHINFKPIFVINANIAPGSSGSPVLDADGQVVGIIFATRTQNVSGQDQQYAVAIPATALSSL